MTAALSALLTNPWTRALTRETRRRLLIWLLAQPQWRSTR